MWGDTRKSLQKANVKHLKEHMWMFNTARPWPSTENSPTAHFPQSHSGQWERFSGIQPYQLLKCWEMKEERTDHSNEKHSEQYLAVGHLVEVFVGHVDLKRVHTCSKTKFKGVAI